MKKILAILTLCFFQTKHYAQSPSKVDYDAYEKLVAEVKSHRAKRLVNLVEFNKLSKEKNTIILDTRSDAMYKSKHIKGAIHLNFSDFTQENLSLLIPDNQTRILIYCNNNFDKDDKYFATKAYVPPVKSSESKAITMALNIPTFINLYGYGYKNVYELSELIDVFDARVEFEGTAVKK
ncbi:MAG: rhodanese-like domain-containing protein [Sphingobacteriaceae bacterium]|nr:rhodanese-like domain-containing protein [Sphingobacteriaceae bacterium]